MSSEWVFKELEEIANEVTVGFVGSMAREYIADGIPFLRSLNIEPFRINTKDLKFISPNFHAKISKSSLHPGDVVIVRTGKPGTCAVIPEWLQSANCSDLVIVRCADCIRPRFLCYWINSAASHHISSHLVGAVQQHFNVAAAKKMQVLVPSLRKQDQIITILGSIDDRITLLSETNVTLEAIAQALFKSWFVDFDPVHAKAEGRQPEGIDAETAALFPDSFEESEFGLVPKGWKAGIIADLGEVICGKTPPTSNPKNYGCDVPFITIPDMHGVLTVTSPSRKLSYRGADTQKNKYLRAGSICVSCIATAGLVVLVSEKAQTNQQINSVVPSDKWGDIFSLFTLRRIGNQVRAAGSGGSVFHNLNKTIFEKIRVLLPEQNLTKLFDYLIGPLIERIILNQKQAESLSSLRDTLLPRLISGQLRLPEKAKFIECTI